MTSVRIPFVLIFVVVQLSAAEYVVYGPLTTIANSLSLTQNQRHHPLITQLSVMDGALCSVCLWYLLRWGNWPIEYIRPLFNKNTRDKLNRTTKERFFSFLIFVIEFWKFSKQLLINTKFCPVFTIDILFVLLLIAQQSRKTPFYRKFNYSIPIDSTWCCFVFITNLNNQPTSKELVKK
jgi:hypothetical protein